MFNGIFHIRKPVNEPVLMYAPGSKERAELQAKLKDMIDNPVEVPCIINGKDISNGDLVEIKSPRGHIKLQAKVTKTIKPGVVSIPHGWPEANANILTDDQYLDPISGFPPFNGTLCQVSKT